MSIRSDSDSFWHGCNEENLKAFWQPKHLIFDKSCILSVILTTNNWRNIGKPRSNILKREIFDPHTSWQIKKWNISIGSVPYIPPRYHVIVVTVFFEDVVLAGEKIFRCLWLNSHFEKITSYTKTIPIKRAFGSTVVVIAAWLFSLDTMVSELHCRTLFAALVQCVSVQFTIAYEQLRLMALWLMAHKLISNCKLNTDTLYSCWEQCPTVELTHHCV